MNWIRTVLLFAGLALGCTEEPRTIPVDECHMQIRNDCRLEVVCGERPKVLGIFECLSRAKVIDPVTGKNIPPQRDE